MDPQARVIFYQFGLLFEYVPVAELEKLAQMYDDADDAFMSQWLRDQLLLNMRIDG